jgi:hypothetical protein
MNQAMLHPALPWWRVPTVWLALGGPALVVLASVITLVIAVRGADAPLRESATAHAGTLAPATQARNHAVAPRR